MDLSHLDRIDWLHVWGALLLIGVCIIGGISTFRDWQ